MAREARTPRSQRPAATKPRYKDKDAVLGRIVGECAGTVSACWENLDQTGIFQSSQASDAVDKALQEIQERFVLVLRSDDPRNFADHASDR